jgi:micrococcal nuclease
MKKILVFVLFVSTIGCNQSNGVQGSYHNYPTPKYYSVKKFVDGDTYWLDDGTQKGVKVRLIGINAPEPRSYFKMKEEPYGKEASAYMRSLVGRSKLRIELDVQELDQYGRLLAYCYFEDGRMVNEEMVRAGYAQVATYPPNVKYEHRFYQAQVYSRAKRLGMWK